MRSVKFKDTWFDITGDGISYSGSDLSLTVISGDVTFEQMRQLLDPIPETIYIYDVDRETQIGEFSGYTELFALSYLFSQYIYNSDQRANMIDIRLSKPGLEKRIDENEAQTFYTAMMTDTLLEDE